MPEMMFAIVIIIIAINVALLFIYMNSQPQNSVTVTNTTPTPQPPAQNNSNQTIDVSSTYIYNCVNSTKNLAKNIENITNIAEIESRFFDSSSKLTSYLQHNWSNIFYSINGTQKDILNKTAVSIFEIVTNRGRNFTIPVLCDINGNIGRYSSCLVNNVPNIPDACYNLTINLSDCENEWANHFILDDIQYWITPVKGTVIIPSVGYNNTSITFNFTISSSRKRLESYGMEITQRTFSPSLKDTLIYSSSKISKDGKGGTLTYKVNLTGIKGVEFYSTAWFVKKCYDKYVIY